ncbi:MAG: S-layer homology domain-containing protein [Cyanobacteria bacterium P01_F01_bin.150]
MTHSSFPLASAPTAMDANSRFPFSHSSSQSGSLILYVDNIHGDDEQPGTVAHPMRTITQALHQAPPGTLIVIDSGDYSSQKGERFPLIVDHGVMLVGTDDGSVHITGGGAFASLRRGQQTVTIVVRNDSTLRGITVTNPEAEGTGIWVETGQPTIAQCQLKQCQREGMVISASGHPVVSRCYFAENQISGLLCLGESSGIIEHNVFAQSEYGIAIGDRATPALISNTFHHNLTGITIAAAARPKLRINIIRHNQNSGLVLLNNAQPDLGTGGEPGQNIIIDNHVYDIQVETDTALVSHGNQVRSDRLNGPITLVPDYPVPAVNASSFAADAIIPGVPEPQVLGAISSTQPTSLSSASSAPPASPALFPDIQNHWAQSFIESLHQHTIIEGFPDGTFRPELSLTRAQYAALLHKMFSIPPFVLPNIHPERPFRDVSPQFWADEAIQHASRMGFIAGFPDGSFRPEEALSRAQAIVSLVNGLRLMGGDRTDLERYGDRTQIPTYAKDEIATATQKQLIINHPDPAQLKPKQPISRAEIATMLYQVRVITGQSVAIVSPYIIQPTALSVSFDDVPMPSTSDDPAVAPYWAALFIYGLANQGLISGISPGTFAPERAVSRAEFAALLTKIFNPLAKRNSQLDPQFVDVPKRFWAHDVIQRVVQAGLMTGFDDGSFQPHQDVMRWQVLWSVTQALGLLPAINDTDEIQASQRLHHVYADAASIPALAKGAIATATTKHLVVNYPIPNLINASRGATRAEVAAILYQSLATNNRLPIIFSPYIVSPATLPSQPPNLPNSPTPQLPNSPTPQLPNSPILLPTALLSPVETTYTVQDLESYLFGYTNQSNLILEAVAAQLQQQDIHVVPYTIKANHSNAPELPIIPTDSGVMIRLQITDQPVPQPQSFDANLPDIDEVAWQFTIFFDAKSTQGLELSQILHAAILARAGLADGGIQSTHTLWPEISPGISPEAFSNEETTASSLQAITPDAAVLIRLSPMATLVEDYPPIPTTPIVWAIASTSADILQAK